MSYAVVELSPRSTNDWNALFAPADITGGGPEFTGRRQHRIMLVDDQRDLRSLLARALRRESYTVVEAESGDMARDLLQQGEAPDVLITDQVMPGDTQGHDLAARALSQFPGMGIILISGHFETFLKEEGHNAIELPKPVSLNKILTSVKSLLGG